MSVIEGEHKVEGGLRVWAPGEDHESLDADGQVPEPRVLRFPLDCIDIDKSLLARERLVEPVVVEYARAMRDGVKFPPVVVFHDVLNFWLSAGFHRVEAARRAGKKCVAAELRTGTKRDALLFAVGADAAHGLRRSNADKRRCIELLLGDVEWRKWSDREIASRCGVSHTFVSKMREEVTGNGCQSAVRCGDGRVMNTSGLRAASVAKGSLAKSKTAPSEASPKPTPIQPGATNGEHRGLADAKPEPHAPLSGGKQSASESASTCPDESKGHADSDEPQDLKIGRWTVKDRDGVVHAEVVYDADGCAKITIGSPADGYAEVIWFMDKRGLTMTQRGVGSKDVAANQQSHDRAGASDGRLAVAQPVEPPPTSPFACPPFVAKRLAERPRDYFYTGSQFAFRIQEVIKDRVEIAALDAVRRDSKLARKKRYEHIGRWLRANVPGAILLVGDEGREDFVRGFANGLSPAALRRESEAQ